MQESSVFPSAKREAQGTRRKAQGHSSLVTYRIRVSRDVVMLMRSVGSVGVHEKKHQPFSDCFVSTI